VPPLQSSRTARRSVFVGRMPLSTIANPTMRHKGTCPTSRLANGGCAAQRLRLSSTSSTRGPTHHFSQLADLEPRAHLSLPGRRALLLDPDPVPAGSPFWTHGAPALW